MHLWQNLPPQLTHFCLPTLLVYDVSIALGKSLKIF